MESRQINLYYSVKKCQELFGFTRHDYFKVYALAKKYNVSMNYIIHHLPQYIDQRKGRKCYEKQ